MRRLPVPLALFTLFAGLPAESLRAAEPSRTPIAALRSLPREDAAEQRPALVRGVVTFAYPQPGSGFVVQDETAGIYVQTNTPAPPFASPPSPGDVIELHCATKAGEFAPVIENHGWRKVGETELPAARAISVTEMLTGAWDCQRVRVTGVVQAAQSRPDTTNKLRLEVVSAGGGLMVMAMDPGARDPAAFLDAEVSAEGVAFTYFNNRHELVGARVQLPSADGIRIEKPAPADPFTAPLLPLTEIRAFSPSPPDFHRRRIAGTVTLVRPGEFVYLQDGERGIRVGLREAPPLSPGDRVEAAGFPDLSRHYGELRGAVVRKIGHAPLPEPRELRREELFGKQRGEFLSAAPDVDGRLVVIRGSLEKIHDSGAEGQRFFIQSGGEVIIAALGPAVGDPARFEPGSEVRVTGVALVELHASWPARDYPQPKNLSLLLRSAADVQLLRPAPWWTPRRLWTALAFTLGTLLAALGWAALLRRQVARRSAQLAAVMRDQRDAAVAFETTLRERERLAADLHDTLEQSLTGLSFQLEASQALHTSEPERSGRHLGLARQLLSRSREEVRRSVWNLRAHSLEGRTLPEALRDIAHSQGEGRPVRITIETEGKPRPLPDLIAGNLLLLAQEAMTNALKHARPKEINLRVTFAEGAISVTIEDDGSGFDPARIEGPREGHFGLQGMRERTKRLGGALVVESAPGRGARITVTAPA